MDAETLKSEIIQAAGIYTNGVKYGEVTYNQFCINMEKIINKLQGKPQ